jgi:hypothetical protein
MKDDVPTQSTYAYMNLVLSEFSCTNKNFVCHFEV